MTRTNISARRKFQQDKNRLEHKRQVRRESQQGNGGDKTTKKPKLPPRVNTREMSSDERRDYRMTRPSDGLTRSQRAVVMKQTHGRGLPAAKPGKDRRNDRPSGVLSARPKSAAPFGVVNDRKRARSEFESGDVPDTAPTSRRPSQPQPDSDDDDADDDESVPMPKRKKVLVTAVSHALSLVDAIAAGEETRIATKLQHEKLKEDAIKKKLKQVEDKRAKRKSLHEAAMLEAKKMVKEKKRQQKQFAR